VRVFFDGKDSPSERPASGFFQSHFVLRLVAPPENRLHDLMMAGFPDTEGHGSFITGQDAGDP
jgi:hypothetical protein